MPKDNRKPTGVRITSTKNGKTVLFLHCTAKSGPEQNARHTIIKGSQKIINDLDPATIGETILKELGLTRNHYR